MANAYNRPVATRILIAGIAGLAFIFGASQLSHRPHHADASCHASESCHKPCDSKKGDAHGAEHGDAHHEDKHSGGH